jgi:hypothetical protein
MSSSVALAMQTPAEYANALAENAGFAITGYDTTNFVANLSTAGVLTFTAVPEPSTWAATVLVIGAMGIYRFRRAARKA